MKRLLATAIVLVLGVGAFAVAAIAATAPTKPATVKTHSVSLGKILVNGNAQTLYLFEKDKNGKSACLSSDMCAHFWPPVLTKGKPKAGTGVKASLLGTTKRADGTTQVTYNKHPLYRFLNDKNKVGATKGQDLLAFGAKWYVVGTNGKKLEKEGS
jgi:predicted lipoprotein with Yx(FWY)xxD motif